MKTSIYRLHYILLSIVLSLYIVSCKGSYERKNIYFNNFENEITDTSNLEIQNAVISFTNQRKHNNGLVIEPGGFVRGDYRVLGSMISFNFGSLQNLGSIAVSYSVDGGNSYIPINKNLLADNHEKSFEYRFREKTQLLLQIYNAGSTKCYIDNFTLEGEILPLNKRNISKNEFVKEAHNANSSQDRLLLENSNQMLGNPTNADYKNHDNYFINKLYYTLSYNDRKHIANWVQWHVDITDVDNNQVKRSKNFKIDYDLPKGMASITPDSFKNSGFVRGHNCPSGDRKSTIDANQSTFLMTNIIPQSSSNNDGVWNAFENYIRTRIRGGDEAYILMGNYGALQTIGLDNIIVPAFIWKIVYLLPDGSNDYDRMKDAEIICINTPNSGLIYSDWKQYMCSLSELESKANIQLSIFPH